jgi:hypothetical protein
MINSLRRQLNDQKSEIEAKDEEIANLKNNAKCAKYSDLEVKFQNALDEYILLTDKFNYLKNIYIE